MNTSEILPSLPLFLLIAVRVFASATHLLVPRWSGRLIGMDPAQTQSTVYARMFGIRNVVLAIGLINLGAFTDAWTFILLNVLVDAVDAVAFLIAGLRKDIAVRSARVGVGISLFAAALGAAALAFQPNL